MRNRLVKFVGLSKRYARSISNSPSLADRRFWRSRDDVHAD